MANVPSPVYVMRQDDHLVTVQVFPSVNGEPEVRVSTIIPIGSRRQTHR